MARLLCIAVLRVAACAPEPGPGPPALRLSQLGQADSTPLYRALDGMSANNREIILLREIQGLKLEDIAAMLKVPLGTVKSRSSRARLELASRVRAMAPSYGASS